MRNTLTALTSDQKISLRILALVREGKSPVDALRAVCGNDVVDLMIDSLYADIRAKVCK
jgi:hypothetical protein